MFESYYYRIESTKEKCKEIRTSSLNRTIIGLKVEPITEKWEADWSLNRTIIGLKVVNDHSTVDVITFV
jgi:hypothetical protein